LLLACERFQFGSYGKFEVTQKFGGARKFGDAQSNGLWELSAKKGG